MMATGGSWGAGTFERLYAADPDPWRFASSEYERAKYATTLATQPAGRCFDDGFEVGCSIGVFTAQLAPRCERLLAVDFAASALARARRACAGLTQVRFEWRVIPADWPDAVFDLIVLSKVLYFLDAADIAATAQRAKASLRPNGLVLLMNWTGPTDTPTTGEAAAELFRDTAGLPRVSCAAGATYRIDLLTTVHGAAANVPDAHR